MGDTFKILIVENDVILRNQIFDIVENLPDTEIIGKVASSRMARSCLGNEEIDLVLLDITMPEVNDLKILENIISDFPKIQVVVLTIDHSENTDNVVKALEIGAIDYIPKLVINDPNRIREFRLRLMTIIGLIKSRRNLHLTKSFGTRKTPLEKDLQPQHSSELDPKRDVHSTVFQTSDKKRAKNALLPFKIDVVVIASSTGGPNALVEVIPNLQKDLNVPVLIVQHMPPLMTLSLANSLDKRSSLLVQEASDGDEILSNVVYFAPGGKHMIVKKDSNNSSGLANKHIILTDDPPVNSVRPAADVLFRSVAKAFGGNILAVIMTGMGNDGMEGVRTMKEKGCYCLSQTKETCVVYGMPKAVDSAGLTDENVQIDKMANKINEITLNFFPNRAF